jgi:hypothetical protein
MIHPERRAQLLQQFAQSRRGDAVVELSADHQIGSVHALSLAKPARQSNRNVRSRLLRIGIEQVEILSVPSRKTRGSVASHNFDRMMIGGHKLGSSPL